MDRDLARSPELSETTRLADRRVVVTGDRAWALGTADGYYPAAGFHTRGEMGGFWLPNVKLLDGMWFGINGDWIGPATKTTSGWGYVRADLPTTNGVRASRTDFVPDGVSGVLVGLTLRANRHRTITLQADAHSELLGSYPWGETNPSQTEVNLTDTAELSGRHVLFRDRGTPPKSNNEAHDWSAAFGADLEPTDTELGKDFRGPQDPAVICPASGPNAPTQPERCDDTEYGAGVGARLTYEISLRAGQVRTVWFAVGGSASSPADARDQLQEALADPEEALEDKVDQRSRIDRRTEVDLPGNRLVEDSVRWSKQMLAASEQRVEDLDLRWVEAGKRYPPPEGHARPDALVRCRLAGLHLAVRHRWRVHRVRRGRGRAVRRDQGPPAGAARRVERHQPRHRQDRARGDPGRGGLLRCRRGPGQHRRVLEVPVGGGPGLAVDRRRGLPPLTCTRRARRRWSSSPAWTRTRTAGRRVSATSSAPGMGEEKLDNAVYTIRGYADLADMAAAVGDDETRRWAVGKARALLEKFEEDWWYGGDTRSYADSLENPGNEKVFQRHWIGLTPTDAVLPRIPGRAAGPLASRAHARATLNEHEQSCYTDTYGLFHTGTGPTSAPAGNPGPSCDSVVSAVPSERNVFTLNSAIAAVSEGNYGRLGVDQQQHYINGNAQSQLDPDIWEMPGAMPEIVPSPDFGANIERLFTERSMVLQAWGAYGILWPVVHQWLGVSPDLGRDRLAVVPQLPPKQREASAKRIRLGDDVSVDVTAKRQGKKNYVTEVRRRGDVRLVIGAVVPRGSEIRSVRLDGERVEADLVRTARGLEVRVSAGRGDGLSRLRVAIR